MGNPSGIALFSFVEAQSASESKLRVLLLAGIVGAIVILGSIGVVRFANRNRQLTPAILEASRRLAAVPDSLLAGRPHETELRQRRDEFVRQLTEGALPVDSVRTFYQSYAMWMRDGRWDASEIDSLSMFLGITTR